jgi:hypothetical protein
MTTPGPDHFFSCPHCKAVLRRWTIGSGNTFGSTLWSDGYLHAPMLPRAVQAARCPSCAKAFFVDDAEDLGEHWTYGSYRDDSEESLPEGYKDAPAVEDANTDALSELILQTEDRDRLRYLCMQTWHNYNQAYRNPKTKGQVQRPAGFNGNLERLIGLLEDDRGQDQVMKAEALRELGKHTDAMAALQDIDAELGWVADQIRAMAQAGVSAVGVLLRPGEERRDS